MKLKTLLRRIALQKKGEFPFPDSIESYVEDFVPGILMKSDSLQQAFGITAYEMEKLYEEAYGYYEEERYLDSLTAFRWLLLFNPYETKYWMGYSANLQLLERYEKALHGYAMAALLDSDNPHPHYQAYICYEQMYVKEDAEKALKLAFQRCAGKNVYDELREEIECLLPNRSEPVERSL